MRITVLLMLALVAVVQPVAADPKYPGSSIYNVTAQLTTHEGATVALDVDRDHPVLISMFYASCQATCPLIVETLRAIERELEPAARQNLRVLLVSFDAHRDTPAALAELARERHIDTARWTIARANEHDVRQIAAVLGVQYKQLPNGDYSHSNVITLLSPQGEIVRQTTTLNRADPEIVTALRAP